jgi:hypothetical protein
MIRVAVIVIAAIAVCALTVTLVLSWPPASHGQTYSNG